MNEIKTTVAEQLHDLQMLMHRASFHGFMPGGRRHNPHRGQGRVLSILRLKPEISQKELNYLLGMSKQALAELLAKLEKSGHITREPAEDDKRAVTIKLTEAGKEAATAEGESDAWETPKILDCLNEEELAVFSEYLSRIIKRYEEQFPEDDYEERRRRMERFLLHYGHGFECREHGPHGFGGHFGGCGRHRHFHGHGY
ncbi:MAG: MarR family transcriptional regulator [Gracilibacteraceae bacterium]|jgi:DNA-binding MarR family transcriptional regulator|nr:MarR family transcriptional regulator [Gracilibacteraceae bacterium]